MSARYFLYHADTSTCSDSQDRSAARIITSDRSLKVVSTELLIWNECLTVIEVFKLPQKLELSIEPVFGADVTDLWFCCFSRLLP